MEKKSIMKKITGSREALLAVILILLCLVVTAISPSFLTPKSIMELLKITQLHLLCHLVCYVLCWLVVLIFLSCQLWHCRECPLVCY